MNAQPVARAAVLPVVSAPAAAVGKAPKIAPAMAPMSAPPSRQVPSIGARMLDPFFGWSFEPFGGFTPVVLYKALDVTVDALVKLIGSPFLLLCGLIDSVTNAGILDYFVCAAAKSAFSHPLQSFEGDLSYYRHKTGTHLTDIFARLARRGELVSTLQANSGEKQILVEALMLSRLSGANSTAWILDSLLDQKEFQPLVDAILKRSWATGELNDAISALKKMRPSENLDALLVRGQDVKRPLVLGHRGLPISHMENSIDSFQAAIDHGADGIEFDMCVTKDGQVVMWHDDDPNGIVGTLREAGWEPEQRFHPQVPAYFSPMRRPVHTLTKAEWKANFGFQENSLPGLVTKERTAIQPIPEISEVCAWAQKQGDKVKRLILDTKLPIDSTDEMIHNYAVGITQAFGPLADKCVVMCPFKNVVAKLKQELQNTKFHFTYDIIIADMDPQPDTTTGLQDGMTMGNDTVSMGIPRIGVDGYATYLELAYAEQFRAAALGKSPDFILWTVDSEQQMRDAMGCGATAILTDNAPAVLPVREKVAPMKPATKSPATAGTPAKKLLAAPQAPRPTPGAPHA